jgi:hypothetical protein
MDRHRKLFLPVAALFVLVLAGAFTLWAQPFGMMSQQPQMPSQYEALCAANGRFVFGQVSDSDKDKFMLDTTTGRLWRVAESGVVGMYLSPVSYRTADGEYTEIPGDIKDSEKKEPEKK